MPDIPNRYTGAVMFSYNRALNKTDLREANLRGADLQGANLRGADLQGANLEGADLEGADLRRADLEGANLEGADLQGANLRGANLEGADLQGANLRGADLQGANLEGADLEGADLRRADLEGANLRGANNIPEYYINLCSQSMLYVFLHLRSELPYLRKKLVRGEVNGRMYEGVCACLIGTLGHGTYEGVDRVVEAIPYYNKGLHNYCEQWFWQIRKGDTSDNSFFTAHALTLIERVLGMSA